MDTDPNKPADGRRSQMSAGADAASAEELARLSRRRALLRGLGKGSALIGAALPIKSMAYTAALTGDGKLCTISGVQSGAHSSTTITALCGGRTVGYYADVTKWPGYDALANPPRANFTNGSSFFDEKAKFIDIFGDGSNTQALTIVTGSAASDEAHWIVALLNANVTISGYVAPYSPAEVVAFYNDPDPVKQAAALAFFKGYMETLS